MLILGLENADRTALPVLTSRLAGVCIQTKDEVLAELMAEHIALKKTLGEL